ncbi:MAG: hypothetical protein HRU35_07230 [Rickettsiaceae bacterium]|nr:hypothetical protein [Rickettsiaceae bacterium]
MTKAENYTYYKLTNPNYKMENHKNYNCIYKKWDINKIILSFHCFIALIAAAFYKKDLDKLKTCSKQKHNIHSFNNADITENMKIQEAGVYYNSVLNQHSKSNLETEFYVEVFHTEANTHNEANTSKHTINYINKRKELSNVSQTLEDTFNNLCISDNDEFKTSNDNYSEQLSSFSKSEWKALKGNHVIDKIFSDKIYDMYQILENDDWVVCITPKK